MSNLEMAAWIERHWRKISALFGLAGIGLILFITAPYGAGVSGDAVDYLSTADSLKRGAGFTDFSGEPYIYWPPLYPLMLAGLSGLLRLDTFVVGGWLNALSFGVVIVLAGRLFHEAFDEHSLWAVGGTVLTLTALPLIQLATNILADVLFIVLVLLYSLWGRAYRRPPAPKRLLGLSVLSSAAAVLRWHGVLMVASVVALALIANRRQIHIALWDAFGAGLLGALPFAAWVLGRNYRLLGSFMGYRDTADISIAHNLQDAAQKIAHWFVPDQLFSQVPLWLVVAGAVILLLLMPSKENWRQFFRRLFSAQHWPWLLFFTLDFGFITFTSVSYDHAAYFDDRYYAPLFVFLALLLGLILRDLVFAPLCRRWPVAARLLLIVGITLWLLYPVYRLYKYTVVSRTQGEPTYNIYNSQKFRSSALVNQLVDPHFDDARPLYSNYPAAVYFYTRKITLRAPIAPSENPDDIAGLYNLYADWPPEGEAALIWFLPNHWHYYYHPDDLTNIADIESEFISPDGIIYSVVQRNP
ncbi:MAG: hypothetical protein AB1801_19755 [Chloroflexota bacterium]